MAESEQTQVIQPKKKMGFGKKLIIILAVIVAFLGDLWYILYGQI